MTKQTLNPVEGVAALRDKAYKVRERAHSERWLGGLLVGTGSATVGLGVTLTTIAESLPSEQAKNLAKGVSLLMITIGSGVLSFGACGFSTAHESALEAQTAEQTANMLAIRHDMRIPLSPDVEV